MPKMQNPSKYVLKGPLKNSNPYFYYGKSFLKKFGNDQFKRLIICQGGIEISGIK